MYVSVQVKSLDEISQLALRLRTYYFYYLSGMNYQFKWVVHGIALWTGKSSVDGRFVIATGGST